MALIKCSECGKEISDRANACIYCGCPIDRKIICVECGKEVSAKEVACIYCGCPLEKYKNIQIARNENIHKTKEINNYSLSGMIVGIVSWFIDFYGLVAAAGLTLSIIGLTTSQKGKNRTFAIVGIVCSGIELILKFFQLVGMMTMY